MKRCSRRLAPEWARLSLLLLVLSVSCCLAGEPAAPSNAETAPPKKILATSFRLNDFNPYLDGQWQGIAVASDGKCYFGSSSHAHNRAGSFFCYDPAKKELKVLSNNLSELCGEDQTKQVPQGKTHSPIVEFEGWIYFATHLATYWPEARDNYTGSHVLGYEMATGTWRDFGITRPNYTCYSAIAVDPNRRVIYQVITPFADKEVKEGGTHLYEIDIATGAKRDLGMFKQGQGAVFWILIDRRGDLWFSSAWDNGTLTCYRPRAGKFERFDDALPKVRSAANPEEEARSEAAPKGQSFRYWGWMEPLPEGNSCLFTMNCVRQMPDVTVWKFDASQPVERAFSVVRHVGVAGARALAGSRLYFLQRESRDPRDAPKDNADYHLMSAALDAKDAAATDHGLVEDAQGRHPNRICSMAADGRGHVFTVGDWWCLPGEKGSLSIEGLRQAPKDGKFVYEQRDRGQFFAVVDVTP